MIRLFSYRYLRPICKSFVLSGESLNANFQALKTLKPHKIHLDLILVDVCEFVVTN